MFQAGDVENVTDVNNDHRNFGFTVDGHEDISNEAEKRKLTSVLLFTILMTSMTIMKMYHFCLIRGFKAYVVERLICHLFKGENRKSLLHYCALNSYN